MSTRIRNVSLALAATAALGGTAHATLGGDAASVAANQQHLGAALKVDASPAGQPGWLSDGRLVFTRFAGGGSTLWWVDPSVSAPPTQVPLTGVDQAAHATGAR